MGDKKAALIVTDPPYGVEYQASDKDQLLAPGFEYRTVKGLMWREMRQPTSP